MNFKSNKTLLLISGITSIVLSRVLFSFLNDPEGPNLLVVMVMAAIVFAVSLVGYLLIPSLMGIKRLSLAVLIQILLVSAFYFFLS
jgi:hypothetical protein